MKANHLLHLGIFVSKICLALSLVAVVITALVFWYVFAAGPKIVEWVEVSLSPRHAVGYVCLAILANLVLSFFASGLKRKIALVLSTVTLFLNAMLLGAGA